MSTLNIHFRDIRRKKKCFVELLEEYPRDSKSEFELTVVNKPSVFESLKFYCTL